MIANLASKTKWILGVVALIIGVTTAVLIGLPAWVLVLLGSMALASLYILARMRSRYDPLDPRFGSCIPPINMQRATNRESPARPDVGDHRFEG
jgi:hypothetical protein